MKTRCQSPLPLRPVHMAKRETGFRRLSLPPSHAALWMCMPLHIAPHVDAALHVSRRTPECNHLPTASPASNTNKKKLADEKKSKEEPDENAAEVPPPHTPASTPTPCWPTAPGSYETPAHLWGCTAVHHRAAVFG